MRKWPGSLYLNKFIFLQVEFRKEKLDRKLFIFFVNYYTECCTLDILHSSAYCTLCACFFVDREALTIRTLSKEIIIIRKTFEIKKNLNISVTFKIIRQERPIKRDYA